MKKLLKGDAGLSMAALLLMLVFVAAAATAADTDHHAKRLRADLVSFNQVPAVLTKSSGKFEAQINEDGTLSYSLSYENMSSSVLQAHIHFGASKTNGGVMVFLCGNLNPTPCPSSGTVSGTLNANDVSLLPATNGDSVIPQGIQPGDFAGLVEAIRSGNAYVNVHTTNFPSGEIRGQVRMAE